MPSYLKKEIIRFLSFSILLIFSLPFQANAIVGGFDPSISVEVLPGESSHLDAEFTQQANGLSVFITKYGKYRLSVDAAGSNSASHEIISRKPAHDAVVVKAFLMAAASNSGEINSGDITLDDNVINWSSGVYNSIGSYSRFFHTVLADVTHIVKPKSQGSAHRTVKFTLKELADNTKIDGEVLAVIYHVPSLSDDEKHTVSLLFGGQRLAGDRFELSLSESIDPTKNRSLAHMGLGISYGCQGPTGCAGVQYSTIDVNGKRLSTSAGGNDDGEGANGALITAGGHGDAFGNPSNPYALPANNFTDDERYNLKPFLIPHSKKIVVDSNNPSNDDNIFFAWFELSAAARINRDSDGDGLLDDWERNGYDHDLDGVIDVPLHELGFDPNHKDIAIAYAWMPRSASSIGKLLVPTNAQLHAVTEMFRKSPVTNPDGAKGINIHWKRLSKVAADSNLSPVWTQFDGLMDPLLSDAERRIYHRMLMANKYSGGRSSGLSRGIPAADFIVSLGFYDATDNMITGTIAHELGHNIGLRHGGIDHDPYKTSHLSVMSYLYQFNLLEKDGEPLMDYQRFRMSELDENKLDEADGLSKTGSDDILKRYGMIWRNSPNGPLYRKRANINSFVDWNRNGTRTDENVSQDINQNYGKSVLPGGYNEWQNIVYDAGGVIGSGIPSQIPITDLDYEMEELTVDEYLDMQNNTIDVD